MKAPEMLLRDFDADTAATEIIETARKLRLRVFPVLANLPPVVQGGALMDILAIWLAGHSVIGNPAETLELRAGLLGGILLTLDRLVAANAKELGSVAHDGNLLAAVVTFLEDHGDLPAPDDATGDP